MEPEKKKRKVVDLNTKLAIVKHLDEGHSIKATADKFSVSKGTVQATKENRNLILKEVESNRSLSKARIVKQSNVNVILWRWFATARAKGYSINGPILQGKAKQIVNELRVEGGDFSTSEGWLQKWKQRNNIQSYKISRKSGNVNLERVEQWKSSLKTLLIGYDLKNVFNMDETGFFFCVLPDSTLSHVKQSCKGGKQGKDRITVVLTCSALGEKLPPWIIGKSKNPRAFREQDMSKLKVKYTNSAKAWMMNPIFNQYLKELDEYFKRKGRKIVLFLDNAPVHIVDEATNLTNVELRYFPPNLTSVLQPLDAGIIRSLKALSRKFEVLSILDNINDSLHASNLVRKLTILDAIKFIDKSWSMVKAETIQKCFSKCNFVINGKEAQELNEIVTQEEELATLTVRIGIPRPNLVIEKQLPEFEIIEEQNLIYQLVEEHTDVADDDEVEEIAIELENLEQPEVPKVVSIAEARDMVTQLILFTKAHSLFNEELDLLSLNATLKDLYNSALK
jgi:transposase